MERKEESLTLQDIRALLAVTIDQGAKISNIGENQLRTLIRANKLPHFKRGNKLLIPMQALIDYIDDAASQRLKT